MKNLIRRKVMMRIRYVIGWGKVLVLAAFPGHLMLPGGAVAQTATLADAWWTYQQDCNGDGCKAGTLPGNRARLMDAASLINYGATELPPGSPPPGPCALSEQMFDPVFGACLVRNGTEMGRAQPVPWRLQIEGTAAGKLPRISAVR